MDIRDYFASRTLSDPATGDPQRNATLQAFHPSDTGFIDPLAVTAKASGLALQPFNSSATGSVPDFRVAGEPEHVVLKSGAFTITLASVIGAVMDSGLAPEVVEVVLEKALASSSDAAEYAAEAEQARDDARAIVTSDVAAAWGFFPILSETPPTQTTMDGVPVLWLDPSTYEAPIVVLPAAPKWDDQASSFTVPDNVIGVDYVWTSGGGGVGATLTPGAALATSGTYPRRVTITPVAQTGYVLASGVRPFIHDFADPQAVSVLVSDGFGGSAADSLSGRALDLALGGSACKWDNAAVPAWRIDGAGHAVMSGRAAWDTFPLVAEQGAQNVQVEFDLVAYSGQGAYGTGTGLVVSIESNSGPGKAISLCLLGAGTQAEILCSNGKGGAADPLRQNIPVETGQWSLRMYGTTVTVNAPTGTSYAFDLSDTTKYALPNDLTAKRIRLRVTRKEVGVTLDNLTVSKVGF